MLQSAEAHGTPAKFSLYPVLMSICSCDVLSLQTVKAAAAFELVRKHTCNCKTIASQHHRAASRENGTHSVVKMQHPLCLQAAKSAAAFELVHPRDQNGKSIADRHCTQEVEEALKEYRRAWDVGQGGVGNELRLGAA